MGRASGSTGAAINVGEFRRRGVVRGREQCCRGQSGQPALANAHEGQPGAPVACQLHNGSDVVIEAERPVPSLNVADIGPVDQQHPEVDYKAGDQVAQQEPEMPREWWHDQDARSQFAVVSRECHQRRERRNNDVLRHHRHPGVTDADRVDAQRAPCRLVGSGQRREIRGPSSKDRGEIMHARSFHPAPSGG